MHARLLLVTLACISLIAPAVRAQSPSATASIGLLDKMAGRWVMTGTIAGKPTTHDVDADWVLKREYIRIHEVSRDRSASGDPGYEAWIYIVWDKTKREYSVMWLDNTAATNFAAEGVGHAKAGRDRIPFIFKADDGSSIHTTFAYDPLKDTWSWTIDNVDKSGKSSSFAKLALARK
jgi:hypothetical protein